MNSEKLSVGWTTVENKEQAEKIATALLAAQLAACIQVDTPITSFYMWKGKREAAIEIRIWIKYLSEKSQEVSDCLIKNHPYEVPQWITVEADHVNPDYLTWVHDCTIKS